MSIIKNIKQELLTKDGPVIKMLHSNEGFKAIAMGFNNGDILKEHKANWPSKLTVIEGSVQFVEGDLITTLDQYDTHDIEVAVLHSVRASKDSICLLTQGKPNDTKRE